MCGHLVVILRPARSFKERAFARECVTGRWVIKSGAQTCFKPGLLFVSGLAAGVEP